MEKDLENIDKKEKVTKNLESSDETADEKIEENIEIDSDEKLIEESEGDLDLENSEKETDSDDENETDEDSENELGDEDENEIENKETETKDNVDTESENVESDNKTSFSKKLFYFGGTILLVGALGFGGYLAVKNNLTFDGLSSNIIKNNLVNENLSDNNILISNISNNNFDLFNNENVKEMDLDKPYLKIGDDEISQSEFNRLNNINLYLQGVPKDQISSIPKEELDEQIILYLGLVDKAKDNGLESDVEKVDLQLAINLEATGSSIDEFKIDLDSQGISYEDLIEFYANQVMISDLIVLELGDSLNVTEDMAKEYYDENENYFDIKEQVKASHILVENESLAKELIVKLENGADFAKLAEKYSTGPSAPKGGDLGFFAKGVMVEKFEESVFSLNQIGNYTSEPVKTEFGYHIILLTDLKEGYTISFEEAKPQIESILKNQLNEELLGDYLNENLESLEFEVFE